MRRLAFVGFSLVLSAGLGLVATGCGSSAASGPSTPNQFVQVGRADLCQLEEKCGIIAQSEVAACQKQANLAPRPYDLDAAVAAGRLSYSSAEAQICLNDISTLQCTDFRKIVDDCTRKPFTGKVAAGGSCQSDIECMNGYCNGSKQGGCMGTCAAYLATGATCTKDGECGGDPNVALCANGQCAATSAVGGNCKTSTDCQIGLICSGAGVCGMPLTVGQTCNVGMQSGNDPCAEGTYCAVTAVNPSSMAATGTCQTLVASGGSCQFVDGCQIGMTCKGWNVAINITTFSVTINPGVCANWSDQGQGCVNKSSTSQVIVWSGCPLDGKCAAANTCNVPGAAGATCGGAPTSDTPAGCQPGSYCNDSNVCATDAAWQATCTVPNNGNNPCEQGTCSGGMCGNAC
jgi:hypothetical protein